MASVVAVMYLRVHLKQLEYHEIGHSFQKVKPIYYEDS